MILCLVALDPSTHVLLPDHPPCAFAPRYGCRVVVVSVFLTLSLFLVLFSLVNGTKRDGES